MERTTTTAHPRERAVAALYEANAVLYMPTLAILARGPAAIRDAWADIIALGPVASIRVVESHEVIDGDHAYLHHHGVIARAGRRRVHEHPLPRHRSTTPRLRRRLALSRRSRLSVTREGCGVVGRGHGLGTGRCPLRPGDRPGAIEERAPMTAGWNGAHGARAGPDPRTRSTAQHHDRQDRTMNQGPALLLVNQTRASSGAYRKEPQ